MATNNKYVITYNTKPNTSFVHSNILISQVIPEIVLCPKNQYYLLSTNKCDSISIINSISNCVYQVNNKSCFICKEKSFNYNNTCINTCPKNYFGYNGGCLLCDICVIGANSRYKNCESCIVTKTTGVANEKSQSSKLSYIVILDF